VARRRAGVSRVNVLFDVEEDGPFFDDAYRRQVIHQFFDEAKKAVADRGAVMVRERVGRAAKHPTGHFAGQVRTETAARFNDQVITDPVVYSSWLEGTSHRNRTTRFRGYKIFRLTRLQLRRMVGPLVQDALTRTLRRLG